MCVVISTFSINDLVLRFSLKTLSRRHQQIDVNDAHGKGRLRSMEKTWLRIVM